MASEGRRMGISRNDRPGFLQHSQVPPGFVPTTLVDAAMPPIISSRGNLRARNIWIDDALGGAARCRRVALSQRCVTAFVIVARSPVHVQAHRTVPSLR